MQNGVPAVYQQGTYAPDANFRWLGSTAQDKAGNQVIGFSVSGKAMKPSIHFAGRLADDPPNELARGEATLLNGTGAQLPMSFGLQPLSRWGDYAMLSLDPVDDCTFWFTTEYIKTDGSANWHTEVGSIKMPGCDSPVPPPTSAWVRLTFPENGAIEAGTLTLTGEAASPATLTKLEFLVDGASVGTAVKSPATATWDSTKVADGSHTVAIRATDSAGWSATSQVNVTVQNAASAGGGGGGCPAGTIDLGGGICLPLGCSTAGAMPGWMAIIALGALLMRRRPRK